MLTVTNLTYRIGGRLILDNCDLNVMDGWRVGVVGANGAGKSTLFKLIMGELEDDAGDIMIGKQDTIAMVRQDMPECDTPLIDLVLEADAERTRLLHQAEVETDPYKIGDIHERLNEIDAYAAPSRAATILTGLGFSDEQIYQPFSTFSGGWRMRVALAAVLFQQPKILLLDEPTNHLDLEAILWLESYLSTYPHTLLIISHDRQLLNLCTDHIVHVDRQKLTLYTGNYDTFERERAERMGLQQKMFEKQQAQRAHMQKFIDRFRYKASKARQAQSRIKALERMDLVDAVIADRTTAFQFPQPEELSPPVISINHADIGYAPGQPILHGVNERIDMDDRIALLGANGNGKSTLIKLIAGKLQPLTGDIRRTSKLRIGYFSQHQTDELDVTSTPYREMAKLMGDAREPAVRAKLGQFGFSKVLADNEIGKLSGGEKARLLFAFMSYDAPHLLLLDEPTNHLDMDAREALVQALNNYEGAVIIVSHDPTMVERVADRLWLIDDGKCTPFDGDLNDYRAHILDKKRGNKKSKAKEAEKTKPVDKAEKKEQKKQDAERRKQFAPLRQKIENCEKVMVRLSKKKTEYETQMADPAVYDDTAKIRDLQFHYGRLLKELEEAEAEWLSATDAYETAVKTA